MIFWLLAPFQYHTTTFLVSSISIVMWETITHIGDIVVLLPFVEMSAEHLTDMTKMLTTYIAVFGHLHHGIHVKMRQLKMSKHIVCRYFRYTFVIIGYQPGHNTDTVCFKEVVDNLYVGDMFGPLGTLYVTFISVIQIVVAGNKECLIKCATHQF